MGAYLKLLQAAGWEYKSARSPFKGQEKDYYGYFVHSATGRIVAAAEGDQERAAWSFVCDLSSE
jgi:hypothetical protein